MSGGLCPMKMEIHHELTDKGVAVIHISGRVMLGEESAQIEKVVAELLSNGRTKFVFELSGVTHMDSTGIGRFIASLNKVMQAGGQMRMAAAAGVVREGFHVTRLDTVFQFFPDLDSACQGFC
jgi:anti-sigma B factor antagonist